MPVSPSNLETDHAGQPKHPHSKLRSARAMEQRKAGRREAAAPAEPRLGDTRQASDRRQNCRTRDLALFNLAIDSKSRGCDVVDIRVDDVAPNGYTVDRATVRQKRTGRRVRPSARPLTGSATQPFLARTHQLSGGASSSSAPGCAPPPAWRSRSWGSARGGPGRPPAS